MVDGRHDLGRAGTKELAEAMFGILLTLYSVIKYSHATVSFVDSANCTPKQGIRKKIIPHNIFFLFVFSYKIVAN